MYASEASHLLLDKNRLAAATCSSVQCSCHITAVTFIYNCNFNGSVSTNYKHHVIFGQRFGQSNWKFKKVIHNNSF